MAVPAGGDPDDSDATVKIPGSSAGKRPPAGGGTRGRSAFGLISGGLVLAVAVAGGVAWWLVAPGSLPSPPAAAEKSRMLTLPPPRQPEPVAPVVAAIVPAPPPVVQAPPASVIPQPAPAGVTPPAPAETPPPAPPTPVSPVARVPQIPVRTADEATILADDTPALSVFAFAQNPAVIVLDFPSLTWQAHMLNRVAVLVEKAGAPHDRLLDDAELDAIIRGGGDTPETFYLGHDYRASELLRFFALAERDHVSLDDEEKWLAGLIKQLGWTAEGPRGALISIPRLDGAAGIDESLRLAILHHELAHGEYFTNPTYAAFVQRFWRETMTREDRAAMTNFLARDHYDTGIEDLIINEAIAYLIHTPDERFFNATIAKLPPRHLASLRADFYYDMPPGWLRDDTPAPPPMPAGGEAPHRATRPRRRYGFVRVSTVSTRSTVALRRLPCRLSARSIAACKSLR